MLDYTALFVNAFLLFVGGVFVLIGRAPAEAGLKPCATLFE